MATESELMNRKTALLDFYLKAAKSHDTQQMIDQAAEIMGNALILCDSANRVLAASSTPTIMDPLWVKNIEKGYLLDEFIQKVRENKDMLEWQKSGEEINTIALEGDGQPKLVARIAQEDGVAGAVVMIAHHTPIAPIHQQLPLVARALLEIYQRSEHAPLEPMQYSTQGYLLYTLLEEREEVTEKERMELAALPFPQRMRVVVTRFEKHIKNQFIRRSLSLDIRPIFPDGYVVICKGYIAVVVEEVTPEQKRRLEALTEQEKIHVGISWPFSNILEFPQYYQEAKDVVKLLEQTPDSVRVSEFTGLSLSSVLRHYTGKVPLSRFCHPALAQLRSYDEARQTAFTETLRTYLHCDRSLVKTAEKLYVHRNTLLYRLRRIEELTELDLSSMDTFISLYLSFKIEDVGKI